MGIKNLTKFLRSKDIFTDVKFKNLNASIVAVDANFFVVRSKKVGCVVTGILNLLRSMKYTKPIFVFDGKKPEMKLAEIEKRKMANAKVENACKQLKKDLLNYDGVPTEFMAEMQLKCDKKIKDTQICSVVSIDELETYCEKLEKRCSFASENDFSDAKKMLEYLGIPVIIAPGEAEIFCVELCKRNIADYVFAMDSDVFAAGCPRVIVPHNRKFVLYDHESAMKKLGLSSSEFLDFCILCGTDFNKNPKRIGVVRAFGLFKAHKSLEEISKKINIEFDYIKIRALFSEQVENVEIKHDNISIEDFKIQCKYGFRNLPSPNLDLYIRIGTDYLYKKKKYNAKQI